MEFTPINTEEEFHKSKTIYAIFVYQVTKVRRSLRLSIKYIRGDKKIWLIYPNCIL